MPLNRQAHGALRAICMVSTAAVAEAPHAVMGRAKWARRHRAHESKGKKTGLNGRHRVWLTMRCAAVYFGIGGG